MPSRVVDRGGAAMVAQILGLLAMLAGIATVWLMNTRPAREQDPDARFWYGFTGSCVLAPLIFAAVSMDRLVGAVSLVMVVATCSVTARVSARSAQKRAASESAARWDSDYAGLQVRHDRVLRAWSRYALDPVAATDFPSMNDVHVLETSALARALAQAEQLRRDPHPLAPEHTGAGYPQAVCSLEAAFRHAELAAVRSAETAGELPSGSAIDWRTGR